MNLKKNPVCNAVFEHLNERNLKVQTTILSKKFLRQTSQSAAVEFNNKLLGRNSSKDPTDCISKAKLVEKFNVFHDRGNAFAFTHCKRLSQPITIASPKPQGPHRDVLEKRGNKIQTAEYKIQYTIDKVQKMFYTALEFHLPDCQLIRNRLNRR